MGFCTRNNDGASGKAESANTISNKDWKSVQDRAVRQNPERFAFGTREAVKARIQGRDNYKNRKSC